MHFRSPALVTATVALVIVAACGGGAPSGDQPTQPPGSDGGAIATPVGPPAADACTTDPVDGATPVSIDNPHDLNPADVTINLGDSVTWTNDSNFGHTITFNAGPDCGYVLVGKPVSVTFNTPGTFTYFCRIFPTYMRGTITVQ